LDGVLDWIKVCSWPLGAGRPTHDTACTSAGLCTSPPATSRTGRTCVPYTWIRSRISWVASTRLRCYMSYAAKRQHRFRIGSTNRRCMRYQEEAADFARLGMRQGGAVVVGAVCVLCGCSATPTRQPDRSIPPYPAETVIVSSGTPGQEPYRVVREAHNAIFYSMESIRASAEQRASTFCDQKGMVMSPLQETTYVPPKFAINGGLPSFEIVFECLDMPHASGDPAAVDPK
jgi:hypothetical protein